MILNLSKFKSTVLLWFLVLASCGNQSKTKQDFAKADTNSVLSDSTKQVVVAANRTHLYLPILKSKSVGIVANQTSVIFKENGNTHLIDSLLSLEVNVRKVFAPEHGFRGRIDAGEHVKDGVDTQTGLFINSLHGKNRKPTQEQLKDLDIVLFDIQDVGVRFYTYISTLQLVMEACAEKGISIVILDRPNPNAHYVDGPTMEKEHTGFLGMNEIPLVYGMSIGEYANMINNEGWLAENLKVDLTVIPLENWTHETFYSLPIRPSPNLPNDTAISLYPSLGLFEGTNVNAGRGTEFQFQRYGASFLDSTAYTFSYSPEPNFGSKYPKEQGKICYGKDLSKTPRMTSVTMEYVIDAYTNAVDKKKVFLTNGFTKHAGTKELQKQIENKVSNEEIRQSWQPAIKEFVKIREKYLVY